MKHAQPKLTVGFGTARSWNLGWFARPLGEVFCALYIYITVCWRAVCSTLFFFRVNFPGIATPDDSISMAEAVIQAVIYSAMEKVTNSLTKIRHLTNSGVRQLVCDLSRPLTLRVIRSIQP